MPLQWPVPRQMALRHSHPPTMSSVSQSQGQAIRSTVRRWTPRQCPGLTSSPAPMAAPGASTGRWSLSLFRVRPVPPTGPFAYVSEHASCLHSCIYGDFLPQLFLQHAACARLSTPGLQSSPGASLWLGKQGRLRQWLHRERGSGRGVGGAPDASHFSLGQGRLHRGGDIGLKPYRRNGKLPSASARLSDKKVPGPGDTLAMVHSGGQGRPWRRPGWEANQQLARETEQSRDVEAWGRLQAQELVQAWCPQALILYPDAGPSAVWAQGLLGGPGLSPGPGTPAHPPVPRIQLWSRVGQDQEAAWERGRPGAA